MLTRSMIEQMAVNDSSFKNGEKLYDKGSFYELKRTEDSKVYWALCEGSGKNPYKVSVDMSDESKLPVCRCSCPSRQFPCKHGIGLMLSIAAGKDFCVDEIPSEIKEKHEKAEEREAKKIAKQAKPKKVTAASIKASEKKIEKQLEGLDLCRKMMNELMTSGLATLSGTSLEKFRELSAELYNYGLPGPQRIINRIAESVANFRNSEKNEDKSKEFYAGTLKHLIHLNTVVKKGRAFLEKKLADKDFAESDDILFEELGGIWKLESLDKIGSFQENARLIADEWKKAMRSDTVCDFVALGDVSIKAIGADNQLPDCEVPVRVILEQIVAKLGIPPFLLGLSWSSTERMSAQQADILTSELEFYRSAVEPAIRKIAGMHLRLCGFNCGFDVEWDNINLQDEVELSQARLNNANALKTEREVGLEVMDE